MKSLLISLLISVSTSAFAVQHFTCYHDIYSDDRAVISLKNNDEGTLFLTSGLDDWGNQDHSGVMTLNKINETDKELTMQAKNSISTFTVKIPTTYLNRNLDDIKLNLTLKNESSGLNVEQELNCYTRNY
jgi:hypothetical protein